MSSEVEIALKKCGYQSLRPHQVDVIATLVKRQDCVLCSPTGSGKSLCFEISPFLLYNIENSLQEEHDDYRNCLTVVVSPLVALMKSQAAELNRNGISGIESMIIIYYLTILYTITLVILDLKIYIIIIYVSYAMIMIH